jgi:hypothetical protein
MGAIFNVEKALDLHANTNTNTNKHRLSHVVLPEGERECRVPPQAKAALDGSNRSRQLDAEVCACWGGVFIY